LSRLLCSFLENRTGIVDVCAVPTKFYLARLPDSRRAQVVGRDRLRSRVENAKSYSFWSARKCQLREICPPLPASTNHVYPRRLLWKPITAVLFGADCFRSEPREIVVPKDSFHVPQYDETSILMKLYRSPRPHFWVEGTTWALTKSEFMYLNPQKSIPFSTKTLTAYLVRVFSVD